MPLAVTTSPALVTGAAASATSASFDAPAGSVIVAVLGCNHYGQGTTYTGHTWTLSNSGAALTWQQAVQRSNQDRGAAAAGAAIYVAGVASARTAMTVTASVSAASGTAEEPTLSVYVCTGADLADLVGAVSGGFGTTNVLTTTAMTLEQADSLVFVAAMDYSNSGDPTSSDLTIRAGSVASAYSYLTGYEASTGAGSSFTANLDGAGTTNVNWTWAAAEIRAASAAAATGILLVSPVCV